MAKIVIKLFTLFRSKVTNQRLFQQFKGLVFFLNLKSQKHGNSRFNY
jgi:hypothetical protein